MFSVAASQQLNFIKEKLSDIAIKTLFTAPQTLFKLHFSDQSYNFFFKKNRN